MDGDENPRDTEALDDVPRPEPPRPPLDEPDGDPEAKPADRLSKQVPVGFLFAAASGAILLFLALVGLIAFFALSPAR